MKHTAISAALSSLRAERANLDKAIMALAALAGETSVSEPHEKAAAAAKPKRQGRHWSPAQRKAFSVAAKKRWAASSEKQSDNGNLATASSVPLTPVVESDHSTI